MKAQVLPFGERRCFNNVKTNSTTALLKTNQKIGTLKKVPKVTKENIMGDMADDKHLLQVTNHGACHHIEAVVPNSDVLKNARPNLSRQG